MEIDPVAARRWVPWPLRPAEPAGALLFIAWFPTTTFGSVYREAGLLLHVKHLGADAVYSPWMIVDDDVALILGRELLGYPKKDRARSTSTSTATAISAVATRRGAELLRMEGTLGERVEGAAADAGPPHRNVRSSLEELAVPKVIAFTPREQVIEAVRRAAPST